MKQKIALTGVPNCGKTTLWNLATGSRAKTGNWPGVTAERLSAPLKVSRNTELIDLPGIYSLAPKSLEEAVTKDFLISGEADSLIIIIDGTKPEQGLYLALELLSLGYPSVLGINFSDEMEKRSILADTEKLAGFIGVPVFLIDAKSGKGVKRLFECAVMLCHEKKKRFLRFSAAERRKKAAFLTEKCFAFKEPTASSHRESLLCSFLVFTVILAVLGLSFVLKSLLSRFSKLLPVLMPPLPALFESIFSGINLLVGFVPDLFSLYFVLTVLEESGLLTRIAFVGDSIFKNLGLSGKSVFPLMLGFGCTVSGVCAAKASDSVSCSKRTLSALMFVPCGARLPLILLMCGAFFKKYSFFFPILLYFLSLAVGAAFQMLTKGRSAEPFMLEIVPLRLPGFSMLIKTAFRRTCTFVKKSGPIILLTPVLIRFLKSRGPSLRPVFEQEDSILFCLSDFLSPLFLPLGIPSEAVIALICGIFSKESALSALVSVSADVSKAFSVPGAFSFLLFYCLYSPCLACLAAISKEFGLKKSIFLFFRQNIIAFLASLFFYQFSVLIKNLFIP